MVRTTSLHTILKSYSISIFRDTINSCPIASKPRKLPMLIASAKFSNCSQRNDRSICNCSGPQAKTFCTHSRTVKIVKSLKFCTCDVDISVTVEVNLLTYCISHALGSKVRNQLTISSVCRAVTPRRRITQGVEPKTKTSVRTRT